jgi:aryl-alcohol dehydrogenase-like predicted oxidoreductase
VRHVGCSNYSAPQLKAALALSNTAEFSRMVSVQPPYNLVQRDIEADLLPLCAAENIGVISYSPLAAGFLTGKYRQGAAIPSGTRFDVIPGHQNIYFTEHGYQVLEKLDAESQATGKSHVQLALSWVLNQPGITSVLIGARNMGHIDQAIASMTTKPRVHFG